jgi:lipopolysaccharide biosynthesis glycosyltransferase
VKVVFCLYGSDLTKYARLMVASCKEFGYEVWQLTDDESKPVDLVDKVIRRTKDCPQVLYRYRHLAEVEPPYLSLDVDLLVVKDVAEGFDPTFDAVMTRRSVEEMPYNGGVFWVNNIAFVEDCVRQIEKMPPEWQNWTGGQRAMFDASKRFRLKELGCREWNYTPINVNDVGTARILHFKGPRKNWMPEAYERLHPRR